MIVDEAHSSQTGEAAKDLRRALGRVEEQQLDAAEARTPADGDRGRRPRTLLARSLARARAPAEPVVLRVHRDAKAQDARAVRHADDRRRTALRAVPPLLDAPGDRGGLHPRRARQLHDLQDLLADREGDRRTTRSTTPRKAAARDRAVRRAAPAQPRAEGRDHRRALPRAHRARRSAGGQGDGRDVARGCTPSATSRRIDAYIAEQGYADIAGARRVLGQGRRRRGVDVHRAEHERLPRERRPPSGSASDEYQC